MSMLVTGVGGGGGQTHLPARLPHPHSPSITRLEYLGTPLLSLHCFFPLSPSPLPSPLDSPRDLAHSLSRAAGPSGEMLKGWLALPPDLCSPYLAAAWNGRLLCTSSCPVEAESSRKCPTSLSLLKHSSWHVVGALRVFDTGCFASSLPFTVLALLSQETQAWKRAPELPCVSSSAEATEIWQGR